MDILGIVSAIIGILSAAIGIYIFASGRTYFSAKKTFQGEEYFRTPWLGIEILQRGEKSEILSSSEDSIVSFVVPLMREPIEIRIVREGQKDQLGIFVWDDDSIFSSVNSKREFCFFGTGIAGATYGLPVLYLNKKGFNYYSKNRLRIPDDKHYSIFVSSVSKEKKENHLTEQKGNLYLVAFKVPAWPKLEVPYHEYEFITLTFK